MFKVRCHPRWMISDSSSHRLSEASEGRWGGRHVAARPAQAVLLAGSWVGCPRPAGWRAGAGPAPTSMPPPRHVPLLSEKERLANSNSPFSNFPLETLALPRPYPSPPRERKRTEWKPGIGADSLLEERNPSFTRGLKWLPRQTLTAPLVTGHRLWGRGGGSSSCGPRPTVVRGPPGGTSPPSP